MKKEQQKRLFVPPEMSVVFFDATDMVCASSPPVVNFSMVELKEEEI